MSVPWTLQVLRAFRDSMNDAKADDAVGTLIGWPVSGHVETGYLPFVWFDIDQLERIDQATSHRLVVVTGVVTAHDPSITERTADAETELEQAITAYYAMRDALADAIDESGSAFNAAFKGLAQPHPDEAGVRPSDGKDFDGVCTIGERWLVTTGSH